MKTITTSESTIGIVGAGIGGLVAAIALRRAGHDVVVFEQAKQFARVGADINLTPNAVRALDGLGVGEAARVTAARPSHRISRTYDTGEETSRLEMAETAEQRYGAPQLTIHRADLLAALADMFPPEQVALGKRAGKIAADEKGISLSFADGTEARVGALIGADGIHSCVRTAMFGAESPRFTGIVGAGIGGLVAAIALRRAGHDVIVFEQAKQFARVGADINLTPNAVRALDGLGVGDAARVTAARPSHRISRTYDTGEETSRLEMAETAEQR